MRYWPSKNFPVAPASVLVWASGLGLLAPSAFAPEPVWDLIAPFFKPPLEYANQFGAYRSPLLFNDGTRVATRADWPRRRGEIVRQWNGLMGPWPPVLARPKWETLLTSSPTRWWA